MLSSRQEGRNASLMDVSLGNTRLSLSSGIRNADTDKQQHQCQQQLQQHHDMALYNMCTAPKALVQC